MIDALAFHVPVHSNGRPARSWSTHPVMGHIALKALAEVNAGSEDGELARKLYASAVEKNDPYSFNELLTIGGEESISLAMRLMGDPKVLYYENLIELRWAMNGITLEKACEIARRYGLLDEIPGRGTVAKTRLGLSPYDSPFQIWQLILVKYGRAAAFPLDPDIEARHDKLILEKFGKAGAGLFDPTRAGQALRRADEEFDVAFEQNGRLYRFRVLNRYGSYDVKPVVSAINGALGDDGHEERFQEVTTGGVAFYVLAVPENLDKVAEKLFLMTEANRDRALEDFKAFEERVMERSPFSFSPQKSE